MKTFAQVDRTQINEMELAITFRMSVKEWRELMDLQIAAWPSGGLKQQLGQVLQHVDRATSIAFHEPPERS